MNGDDMRDLSGSQLIAAPRGLEEIVASFGDIYEYIQPGGSLDPRWQADFLTSVDLPFSLPLAWDPSLRVNRMTCHKRMVEIFASVFDRLQARGLAVEDCRVSADALRFVSNAPGPNSLLTVGGLRLT